MAAGHLTWKRSKWESCVIVTYGIVSKGCKICESVALLRLPIQGKEDVNLLSNIGATQMSKKSNHYYATILVKSCLPMRIKTID